MFAAANDEKAKASAPPSWGTNGHPPPPPPPHYPHQSYGAVTMEPVAVPVTQVILVGGCPACRVRIKCNFIQRSSQGI